MNFIYTHKIHIFQFEYLHHFYEFHFQMICLPIRQQQCLILYDFFLYLVHLDLQIQKKEENFAFKTSNCPQLEIRGKNYNAFTKRRSNKAPKAQLFLFHIHTLTRTVYRSSATLNRASNVYMRLIVYAKKFFFRRFSVGKCRFDYNLNANLFLSYIFVFES